MATEKSNERVQWEKLKGEPLSVKIKYIFEYYGFVIGIAAFVVFLGVFAMFFSGGGNSYALSGIVFDVSFEGNSNEINKKLCKELGLNPTYYVTEFYPILLDGSDPAVVYDEQEALYARIASGDVDFLVGREGYLMQYVDPEKLIECDILMLDELLPADLIQRLDEAGRVLYADTEFAGKAPFMIDISHSFITDDLQIDMDGLYLTFACKTARGKALTTLCELLLEEN